MKWMFSAVALAVMVVACGGGGGSAGDKIGSGTDSGAPGGSTGGNGAGGGNSNQLGTMTLKLLTGGSQESKVVTSIAASEKAARVQVALKDAQGAALAGEIVAFTENGPGLLSFSPAAATALTDAQGVAEIEVAPLSLTSLGATSIEAKAGEVSASLNMQITTAVTEGVDPQALVQSVGFVSVVPADKSIVIAGAGGNGRSESAILQFELRDSVNNPVKGAEVDFEVIPPGAVQLNIAKAASNNDGIVTTSVSSTANPTSVTVKATVKGRGLSTQSDTLTVTTGISTQRGFDLSASKYNLNADLSGDSSTIRVAIVDNNGNPVADGVPVLAVADFGRIGTSNRGGCTTANGICEVEYQVQNPRPADGQPVTLTFSTQTGNADLISDSLNLWVTSVNWGDFYSAVQGGGVVNSFDFSAQGFTVGCKYSWEGFLGTPGGLALPAGTAVTIKSRGAVVQGGMDSVLDNNSQRSRALISFTLQDAKVAGTEVVDIVLTQGNRIQNLVKQVSYPKCDN